MVHSAAVAGSTLIFVNISAKCRSSTTANIFDGMRNPKMSNLRRPKRRTDQAARFDRIALALERRRVRHSVVRRMKRYGLDHSSYARRETSSIQPHRVGPLFIKRRSVARHLPILIRQADHVTQRSTSHLSYWTPGLFGGRSSQPLPFGSFRNSFTYGKSRIKRLWWNQPADNQLQFFVRLCQRRHGVTCAVDSAATTRRYRPL